MKRKLLWISHFLLYPETGFGALQRSRNLLQVAARDFEITLICLLSEEENNNNSLLDLARSDLSKYCSEIHFDCKLSKPKQNNLLFWIKEVLNPLKPFSVSLFKSKNNLIENIIKQRKFAFIFSDTLGLTEYCLPVIKCPVILNHHNIESEMMRRRAIIEEKFFKKILYYWEAVKLRRYEKKYCKQYSLNLVVSKNDQMLLSSLIDSNLSRIEVIANSVNTSYFVFHDRISSDAVITFVGGLNWYPNLSAVQYFVREIWPELHKKKPAAIFKVVGKYQKEIDDVEDNVVFLNFVPDIRQVLQTSRVFVCPIIDGGGTRLKILDAVALGLPVVTTSIGVEGLDFEHEKHLLIADTAEDFVQAVIRLLEDEELCKRLTKDAKMLLDQNYSLDIVSSKFRDLLGSLT